jgi:site-specific recombinase XerD
VLAVGEKCSFHDYCRTADTDHQHPILLPEYLVVDIHTHHSISPKLLGSLHDLLKGNQIIFGNPAETVEGPIREEKEPAILLKTEYKALLQVAGDNPRNFAIVMLFLQSGLRVSELVNLKVQDVDFVSREITVRQGKGKKDRVVPLVGQAIDPLKAYLAVREANPEYDNVFIARNGTSMDVRTVRYAIHKYYKEAGIKKKASVHTLRHTFSTHQVHNGLPIQNSKRY